MKLFKNRSILLISLLLFLAPYSAEAANKMSSIEIKGEKAEVTFIIGKVVLVKTGKPLAMGDFVVRGDRVRTDKKARIELKLPDGSFIRFNEQTTFELISAALDKKKKQRKIRVSMILGKTWAKVSKLFKRGRFEILTKTAVCGVRGTIYRLNVNQDDSVMVKVYWGEIVVNSREKEGVTGQTGKMTKPSKVSGPHPVQGPHPVTVEEWIYIVKSLQQINIAPDGIATKPFRFSIKDDLNEWVRWNQERDKIIGDI